MKKYRAPAKKAKATAQRYLKVIPGARDKDKEKESLSIRYNLGLEHYHLGNYRQAIHWFEGVYHDCDRQWQYAASLFLNYATCLLEEKEYPAAVEVLQRGIDWFPAYTDLFYLKGLAHKSLNQPDAAMDAFNHCLKLGESPPGYDTTEGVGSYKACQMAGEVLEEAEAYDQAVKAYTLALQCRPKNPQSLKGLARSLVKTMDYDQCLAYLDRYFIFSDLHSLHGIVDAFLAAQAAEVALMVARRALAQDPQDKALALLTAQACLWREREILHQASHYFKEVPAIAREQQGLVLGLQQLEELYMSLAKGGEPVGQS
ncbi:MAG: tetratricopeptide repeat protein [Bacillota bacterium]